METHSVKGINSYHAHVYYGGSTRAAAARLRDQLGARFAVELGRWHEGPVGPHPLAMYQVSFTTDVFASLVPWLMLNRVGLTILVHPNTGDEVADHAANPLWLGEVLPLDIAYLRASTS